MTTKIITESDLLAAMRAQANDKAMGMPHAFSERDVAYVWFRLPVLPDSGDLETAVSNALSAATEGGDYTEAPDPSDEPGSPYVKHIAANLAAAGVQVGADTGLREAARAVVDDLTDGRFTHATVTSGPALRVAIAAAPTPAIDRVKRAAYRLLSTPLHMVYGRDGEFTPCHCEACGELHAALAAMDATE